MVNTMEMMVVRSKNKKEAKPVATPAVPLGENQLRQRIAEKAYGFYLERGQHDGHDVNDWLEAEQVVLSEIGE